MKLLRAGIALLLVCVLFGCSFGTDIDTLRKKVKTDKKDLPADPDGSRVEIDGLELELINDGAAYRVSRADTAISGAVIIPAKYNEKPVKEIDSGAFYDCAGITEITIPAGITSIGSMAFVGCTSLIEITIPASVTSIGNSAFAGDWNNPNSIPMALTTVTFAAGSRLETIGNMAFVGCTGLTEITIPASVTSIGNSAFAGDGNNPMALATVTFAAGSRLQTIGDYAFHSCTSLTSITIPASVTSIGNSAFDMNNSTNSLTTVTFAAGSRLQTIGDRAFYYCYSLTGITIPASVTSIGNSAFAGRGWWDNPMALATVTFAAGSRLETIGSSAFLYCIGLTSITIPAGVTTIGDSAFQYCGLTGITIPASVTSIGDGAFSGSITNITVDAGNQNYVIQDNILYNKVQPQIIFIGGISGNITILEGVTTIGDNAFYNCTSITGITIPASVTSIGEGAFQDCDNLTTVTFAAGSRLQTIGGSAFSNCTNLTGITIPASVTSIGYYAFFNCTSLTGITIPASVTSIGDWAFSYCTSLISITIPASVTTIGEWAFYCNSLTSVTFAAGSQLQTIGDYAFNSCDSLTGITIPASVTSIGDEAFYYCQSLATVTFAADSQLQTIGSSAFYSCHNLTEITIPASVTTIGNEAFSGIYQMTIYVAGHASEEAAFDAWGFNWHPYGVQIKYWNGSEYQ